MDFKRRFIRGNILSIFFLSIFFLGGCATSQRKDDTLFLTKQTNLTVKSDVNGEVYINEWYVGKTPLVIPLIYKQEYVKKTRKINYWKTQPGWSLLLTVSSLGTYLPFSLIPVEIETPLEPRGSFEGNEFIVRVNADGYKSWEYKVCCNGEENIILQPDLEKKEALEVVKK